MLIQSPLPSSIEDALFSVFNHGLDALCDWIPDAGTWQMCRKCDDHCSCRKAQLTSEENRNTDHSCSFSSASSSEVPAVSIMSESSAPSLVYKRRKLGGNSVTISSSEVPAVSIMSESSAPSLVYKRRKLGGNSVTILSEDRQNRRAGDNLSFVSLDAPSVPAKVLVDFQIEHETEATQVLSPLLCNGRPHALNPESFNRCSAGDELVSTEVPKNIVQKFLELSSVNDSCSSSKSNMEHVSTSMKTEVDETAECSSSSAIITDPVGGLSEKDLCISILRSHELLRDDQATRICGSTEDTGSSSSDSYRRLCKICSRSGTSLKMLICDHCEEAFHKSCCQPRIKKIPIDEWFCQSCLRKKNKILIEKVKMPNINNVMSRNSLSKAQKNSIMLMLRDTEPYRTSIRVGKGFQAEVPDWSGPINDDVDSIGEPQELDCSEYVRLLELDHSKPSRLIGNWLQCRAVVDHANGSICGKWRRAPLFEVQTNDWECFCCNLWDPRFADCNVPQELETDAVLKQLKYIETLRPRLSAKRHSLDSTKSNGDLQHPIIVQSV